MHISYIRITDHHHGAPKLLTATGKQVGAASNPLESTNARQSARPLVSVIIPNCNGRKHLEKCLPSIVAQTCKNIELILVDNASTDDSIAFTKSIFSKTKFISNNKNRGFATAVTKEFVNLPGHMSSFSITTRLWMHNALRLL